MTEALLAYVHFAAILTVIVFMTSRAALCRMEWLNTAVVLRLLNALAIERVRVELEVTGIATAFVGPTFTLAELRAVYEAAWGTELDAANFRRSVIADDGWVIPTGRRTQPGPTGGRPAELYRAGKAWKNGGPIHRIKATERRDGK